MRHPESSCRNVSELGEHQQHEPDDISMPEDWNTTGAQITAWALGDRALRFTFLSRLAVASRENT
jgi:hypothetical protein